MSIEHCRSCGSCGFPMQSPEDFAGGQQDALFCSTCGDERGQLKPYDAVLAANAAHYVRQQGLHPDAARALAAALLASMPAWKTVGRSPPGVH